MADKHELGEVLSRSLPTRSGRAQGKRLKLGSLAGRVWIGTAMLALMIAPLVRPAVAWTAGGEAQTAAGYYLVFELDEGGAMRLLYSTVTSLHSRLQSLSEADVSERLAASGRNQDVIGVTLHNSFGQVVYRNTVEIPKWIRGEFLRESPRGPDESNIDGHWLAPGRKVFVVRTPVIAGATLSLGSQLISRPAGFEFDSMVLDPDPSPAGVARLVQTPSGWDYGDPDNRVDLLIMGDGYTAAQQSLFESDALALINDFFNIKPYNEYRNYVNVRTLYTPSQQSGADQPPYDPSCEEYRRLQSCCGDQSASAVDGGFVNTAFDASFCSYNMERLLTVDTAKVLTAAAAEPDWDRILLIVNDSTYGGSGGSIATVSNHSLAVDIAQHEYGHSFTDLADEYSSPYPGYGACSDTTPNMVDCERNVTDETLRSLVKWEPWIAQSMPVPSSGAPPLATDAGLWEGARYLSSGMFRQGFLCMMRSLANPFCDVASEAYALRLYEGGWGNPSQGIDTIEPGSAQPPAGNVIARGARVFSATLLAPDNGPGLDVNWYVDGGVVSSSTALGGDTVSYLFDQPSGAHTLELEVIDRSPIIHTTRQGGLARRRTWNVTVDPYAPTTTMISIVSLDGPGEGLNDPTPVTPVGGNWGITLGEQRLIAFQHAASLWAASLATTVEVRVAASFDPLSCSASSAVLGQAGPNTVHRDFAGAPVTGIWYPQALANQLAGTDLDNSSDDISAQFNSALGTTCSFPCNWYYGLDGSPWGCDIDLVSVVLHELGHGLGFLTLADLGSGVSFFGFDDAYMLTLEDHSLGLSYSQMTDGERSAANVGTGDLHWTGPAVLQAAGGLSSGVHPGGHVEMFAPSPLQSGSSLSHFSNTLFPDESMEPFYTGANHNPGLALQLLNDLGWSTSVCGNGTLEASENCGEAGAPGCPAGEICDACSCRVPACGDVNGDGDVNVVDAMLVAQMGVNLRECGSIAHVEQCDINPAGAPDGACNIADALKMAQCDVGLIACDFSCLFFSCANAPVAP